jgi:uncharacterized protein YdhG (YjbR/CyaY superfamily)
MAKTNYLTVDEYISTFPKDVQRILEQIRQTIQAAVPEAEEVISYQLPAFKFHGFVFYFSAYKNHYSLSCPPPFTVFTAFKEGLLPYKVLPTAIQFPLVQPVPVELIRDMAIYRANENLEKAKAKPKKS